MSEKLTIDNEAIRELAEILVQTDLSEIEYENNGKRIRVARNVNMVASIPAPISLPQTQPANTPIQETTAPAKANNENAVKSPMVGTAYLAPDPSSAPFVKVGDQVSAGQTLMIIEAMKVMNPIKAPRAGKITHIFVQDSQPVEFGEPLLSID